MLFLCVILASPTVSSLKAVLPSTSSVSVTLRKAPSHAALHTFSEATSQTLLNSFFGDHDVCQV